MMMPIAFPLLLLQVPLQTQVSGIADRSRGPTGVYAEVLETHTTVALNADERFPMQSVYKLPICMAVLDLVDRHAMTLDTPVQVHASDLAPPGIHSPLRDENPKGGSFTVAELIHSAIADSDGTASDVLLGLAGGPETATAYLRGLGLTDINIAATEAAMSRDPMIQYTNFATPRAAVALLAVLQAGPKIAPRSRAILLNEMTNSTPGAKRLKGLLPAGTRVAHKTGTDGTVNGMTRATNDIGIITLPGGRHLAIAVFIKDSTADEATREATIANIAKTVFDAWRRK
jgi:beta-lactamase class A